MNHSQQKLIAIRYTIRGIELDATGSVSPGWFSRLFERGRVLKAASYFCKIR
jgi:hypothetical protein